MHVSEYYVFFLFSSDIIIFISDLNCEISVIDRL